MENMNMKSQNPSFPTQEGSEWPQHVSQHTTIGAVAETKPQEPRVALTPEAAREFVQRGHNVFVEADFAVKAGFTNQEYEAAGAQILGSAQDIYKKCSIIMKVNPPQPEEYKYIQPDQVFFCFTEAAADASEFVKQTMSKRTTVFSYDLIGSSSSSISTPVADALSEIAGFLGVQQSMKMMEVGFGKGVCFGQTAAQPGVHLLILGASACGLRAAVFAAGSGAQVTLLDESIEALQRAQTLFKAAGSSIVTMPYTTQNLERLLPLSDVLLGCTPTPSRRVSLQQLGLLKPGSVAIDLTARMGGSLETPPQQPQSPLGTPLSWKGLSLFFPQEITWLVPHSASAALAAAALPHALYTASYGWQRASASSPALQRGLFAAAGKPIIQQLLQQSQYMQQNHMQQQQMNIKQQLNSGTQKEGQTSWTIEA